MAKQNPAATYKDPKTGLSNYKGEKRGTRESNPVDIPFFDPYWCAHTNTKNEGKLPERQLTRLTVRRDASAKKERGNELQRRMATLASVVRWVARKTSLANRPRPTHS